MISFFFNIFRFIKILLKGLKSDHEFRFLFILIFILLTTSTVFYTIQENWSVINALYFSVMTMATVGYGDFTPSTGFSKLFTIVYTFLSIGTFVAFTAKIVSLTFDIRRKRNQDNNGTYK